MGGLKRVLEDAAESQHKMGGAISDTVMQGLAGYRKRQFLIFILLFVVVMGVVLFSSYAITRWPDQMKILVGTIGISMGGGITLMRTIWKEWSQADLLLIIIEEAKEAQVQALIDKLIKNL